MLVVGTRRVHGPRLTVQTEGAIAEVLMRDPRLGPRNAATLAHIVSAIMFLSMAATLNISRSVTRSSPRSQSRSTFSCP